MLNFLLASAAVLGTLSAASPTQQRSDPRSPADDVSWHAFVRASPGQRIAPVNVVDGSAAGDISNPLGLINGEAPTVLRRQTTDVEAPCLTLDFGQNTVGLLSIDFVGSQQASSENGTQRPGVTLAFSETLQFLTNRSDFTRSDNAGSNGLVPDGVDHIAVGAEPYSWQDFLGCQYEGNKVCADGLHGFRYIRVCLAASAQDSAFTSNFGEVAISAVHLDYEGYHGTPDTFTGWFECSDPNLSQWWFDGVYTNDMTIDTFLANNTEPRNAASPSLLGKLVLHDGAKRDRDPYVGDLSVSALTAYLSRDVAQGVENVLADLADHQRADGWIPPASINDYTLPLFDYPLHWVKCTHDLVFYTGASSYLNKYYSNLLKVLDTYYPSVTEPMTGLLSRPAGMGDYAFISRDGQITYYNALYVLALKKAAELAESLGKVSDAVRWRERADLVSVALLSRNWDATAGAFFDGGSCGSALCQTHPQDGNSFAILAGALNISLAESALDFMATHMAQEYGNAFYDNGLIDGSFSSRVYAFLSYFEISARFQVSSKTAETAFDEIRRLYGWMATHDPEVTQWEGIGANGTPYEGAFTSMAHGWSTGIVPLLSNHVLGVTPTGPGFSRWVIKPAIGHGGLTWARGAVPTPKGDILVEWSIGPSVIITVTAPNALEGTVLIPVASTRDRVAVNGQEVDIGSNIGSGWMQISHNGGVNVYTIGNQ